eukprot:s642_g35.t1
MDERLEAADGFWTGVVEIRAEDNIICLAQGQHARLRDGSFTEGQKVTLYDARRTWFESDQVWHLSCQPNSIGIVIPDKASSGIGGIKDICAGMGGITQGMEFVGFQRLASLDHRSLMCETLRRNGHMGVVQGDVLNPLDRAFFHATPSPMRCTLVSGFPCQPLSSQGDQRGCKDERSRPFFAVAKTAWEQQCLALVLENVKAAKDASYIQRTLQQLAWSMGMNILQDLFALEDVWPSRRTRWWLIMVPQEYNLRAIPPFPKDGFLAQVGHILPEWPLWSEEEEAILQLTEEEPRYFHDETYGTDLRWLRQEDLCPCILHSYSSALTACPCGCRKTGFHPDRLLRDGIRGFFVFSRRTNKPRWLHPREAALLCGLDPRMHLPDHPKEGLCLIGQCASPLQASWVGSHLLDLVNGTSGSPFVTLQHHRMWLLRQAQGLVGQVPRNHLEVIDAIEGNSIQVKLTEALQVHSLLQAERRLHGEGAVRAIHDLYGRLCPDYEMAGGPVAGHFVLVSREKKQKRHREPGAIEVTVMIKPQTSMTTNYTKEYQAGVFVFELFSTIPGMPRIKHYGIMDSDERNGIAQEPGIGDRMLDKLALRMQRSLQAQTGTWVPAQQLTRLVHQEDLDLLKHWLVGALHGVLRGVALLQGHWILLELRVQGNLLYVHYWDGLHHAALQQVRFFAEYAAKILVLRTIVVEYGALLSQQHSFTCGAIALMHLGLRLGYWTFDSLPNELMVHQLLDGEDGDSTCFGKGWDNAPEEQIIPRLQEILHQHGVPENRSEERAMMALKKIGAMMALKMHGQP